MESLNNIEPCEEDMNHSKSKGALILYLLLALSACATSPKALNPIDLIVKGAQCFGDPTGMASMGSDSIDIIISN